LELDSQKEVKEKLNIISFAVGRKILMVGILTRDDPFDRIFCPWDDAMDSTLASFFVIAECTRLVKSRHQ